MEYTLGHYQDKEYINYIDEDGKVCDNLHYFSIDVLSGAFQKIMFTEDGIPKVGGFTANMTVHYIKKKELDCKYMLFVPIPRPTNKFMFTFIYLDKDRNLLDYYVDDSLLDFLYFKQKYKDILCEGNIWDLPYNNIKEHFCPHPTTGFGIEIDGKELEFGDVLLSKDFDIFEDEFRKECIEDLHVSYYLLELCTYMKNPAWKITFYDYSDNIIKRYQYRHKGKTKEELQKNGINVTADYEQYGGLGFVKNLHNAHLFHKSKEANRTDELEL